MCGEKRAVNRPRRSEVRITPACAGKRATFRNTLCEAWDHPRVRGEKLSVTDVSPAELGSPPRARGKRDRGVVWTDEAGSPPRARGKGPVSPAKRLANRITPACAGKSVFVQITELLIVDHPRVHGEKRAFGKNIAHKLGSPPRVRGKVTLEPEDAMQVRITPACAGKSSLGKDCKYRYKDHPRVCGEKWREPPPSAQSVGSPPRVRGKGQSKSPRVSSRRDHPRVCGEKWNWSTVLTGDGGSPPRVRGKGVVGKSVGRSAGITPACAGKSGHFRAYRFCHVDHPRVCGEKFSASLPVFRCPGSPPACAGKRSIQKPARVISSGSPPRVRGKVELVDRPHGGRRITPACAGKRCCG